MPPDKVISAQVKVDRAYQHIEELETELLRFQNTKPYVVTGGEHPQTRELVYWMAKVGETPIIIPLIASDILHNLRVALDHLVWAFTEPRARGPNTSFPIYDPAKADDSFVERKIKGICPEAREIITNLKPYKGGNNLLWELHELNRSDKHRLLVTVAASLAVFNIGKHTAHVQHGGANLLLKNRRGGFVLRMAQDVFVAPGSLKCPLKAGDILLIEPPGTKLDKNIDFRFHVAFHEPGIVEGKPVIEIAHQARSHVAEIINLFARIP